MIESIMRLISKLCYDEILQVFKTIYKLFSSWFEILTDFKIRGTMKCN